MRNAVLQVLVAVADEPVGAVHVLQIGLCVDTARVVAHLGDRGLHQPRGVPVPAVGAFGAHPSDPEDLLSAGVLLHQPQRRDHLPVGTLQPEMARLREQVAAVEFRVGAGLLDDEDLDAQLEQLIERGGVQILRPAAAQRGRHTGAGASSLRTLVP